MPDPSRIIEMASAFYSSCALFSAIDVGLFNCLAEKGRSDAEEIAKSCGLNSRGARLLLDACAALDLITKEGELYSNTEESAAFLVSSSFTDLSKAIRYNRDVYPAWGKLSQFVKTGQPVEAPSIHLGDDPERTRNFVLSMHFRALGIGLAAVPMLSLAGRKQVLDVGGGPGTYSVLIARANPEVNCLSLDLPEVVKVADELIAQQGMSDRVKTLKGDYHIFPFPGGNDAVLFFGMLHQESPESIIDLLKRAYASLNPGGLVYVMDMMTDKTHTRPVFSALFAVNMALTAESGWVFSDEELKGWLERAGFEGFSVKPLPSPTPHWLAEAKKPGK